MIYETYPRCGAPKLGKESIDCRLSRRDNKIHICVDCYTEETMFDFMLANTLYEVRLRDEDYFDKIVKEERKWVEHEDR